jgi:hypothetical protein
MKLTNEEKCIYCREYGNLPCDECNKKLEAKKAMSKRLEEIALEYGLCNCDEAYTKRNMTSPDCPFHAFAVSEAMEQYAREVAQASLEKASKNASAVLIENKAGIVIPYVSKGSITNPDNIVML